MTYFRYKVCIVIILDFQLTYDAFFSYAVVIYLQWRQADVRDIVDLANRSFILALIFSDLLLAMTLSKER